MALLIGLGFSKYHNLVIEERKKGRSSKGGARQFQHEPPILHYPVFFSTSSFTSPILA